MSLLDGYKLDGSLLDDYAIPCVLMEKKRIPDGAGGYMTEWTEGMKFSNYQYLDTSMEARRAEQEGVKSLYSALVDRDFPLEYGDAFKDLNTGLTYRVTSNPDDKKAPASSTFDLKYFTVERWNLTS